jgi:hypothetical protein
LWKKSILDGSHLLSTGAKANGFIAKYAFLVHHVNGLGAEVD